MQRNRKVIVSTKGGRGVGPNFRNIIVAAVATILVIAGVWWALAHRAAGNETPPASVEKGQDTPPTPRSKKLPKPATNKTWAKDDGENSPAKTNPPWNSAKQGERPQDSEELEEEAEGHGEIGEIVPEILGGDDGQKLAALAALATLYAPADGKSDDSTPGSREIPDALRPYWRNYSTKDDSQGAGEDGEGDEGVEGEEFHNTVDILSLALEDASPAVREAALQTMLQLPDAEKQLLSLHVLDGDDAALKKTLLSAAKAEGGDASVTLLMQALDNTDPSIKNEAGSQLEEMFSRTFESTGEALEWWEDYQNTRDAPDQDPAPGESPSVETE